MTDFSRVFEDDQIVNGGRELQLTTMSSISWDETTSVVLDHLLTLQDEDASVESKSGDDGSSTSIVDYDSGFQLDLALMDFTLPTDLPAETTIEQTNCTPPQIHPPVAMRSQGRTVITHDGESVVLLTADQIHRRIEYEMFYDNEQEEVRFRRNPSLPLRKKAMFKVFSNVSTILVTVTMSWINS